jgi:hypothetical protein
MPFGLRVLPLGTEAVPRTEIPLEPIDFWFGSLWVCCYGCSRICLPQRYPNDLHILFYGLWPRSLIFVYLPIRESNRAPTPTDRRYAGYGPGREMENDTA